LTLFGVCAVSAMLVFYAAEERAAFKLERLDAYLSEWKWRRTVDVRGVAARGVDGEDDSS